MDNPQGFIPDDQFAPDVPPASGKTALPHAQGKPDGFIPDDQFQSDEDKYGTPGQKALTAIEGLGRGIAGPLATGFEKNAFLVPEQDILMREKTNPVTSGVSEAAGLGAGMLTGTGEAKVMSKAGQIANEVMGLDKAATTGGKIAQHAVQQAAEMLVLQGGDELSKTILNDPEASAQNAMVNMGLAAGLGGVTGAAIGSISPLWKATVGNKVGPILADMKGRINFRVENPDLQSAFTKEMQEMHGNVSDSISKLYSDDVVGGGVKADQIAKAMPEVTEKATAKIDETMGDIFKKVNDSVERMSNDVKTRGKAGYLAQDLSKFEEAAMNPEASYADKFNAIDELKRTLQGYSKYGASVEDSAFGKASKSLAAEIKPILESPEIWGKAANVQKEINGAIHEFLPSQKDMISKFTSQLAGDKVIDPAKVSTYLGQIGKPSAEIKQEMVKNYLNKSDKLISTINDIFTKQGLDAPLSHTSASIMRDSIGEKTAGSKIIDTLIDRQLHTVLGKTLGGAIGSAIGSVVGHGGLGFLAGEHALGPLISSVLPPLINPIKGGMSSAQGLKSAIDFTMAAVNGEKTMNKAAAALLKPGAMVLATKAMPGDADRTKLTKIVDHYEKNPTRLLQIDNGKVGHYLPNHQTELAKTSAQAIQYLQSIKPKEFSPGPLDKPIQPSEAQMARYHRALDIAQEPMVVLQHIKNGTLQQTDIKDLSSMYPAVYRQLVSKVSNEMMGRHGDEESISYKTKLGISLFLGQPVDASMNPMSIQNAQPKPKMPPQQPQGQGKSRKSTQSMGKTNKMYQTPGQNAEADRSER